MTNNMANILKNVIRNGGLPLSQVSERIETMYLSGRISSDERLELTEMMHEKAAPENEAGDYKALYVALVAKYNDLEQRVIAIEKALNPDDSDDNETDSDATAYPEWKPWDGVSGGYSFGDIVTHNGKIWQNMLESMKNVWEPGGIGVDERYWMEVNSVE